MVDLVVSAETLRKKLSGRPQKLDYTDQVLMTLEYLREYRTYFHVANDYEISESALIITLGGMIIFELVNILKS